MATIPQYLTLRAAARLAGCAHSTIAAAVKRGDLGSYSLPTVEGCYVSRREVSRFRPRPVGRPRKSASKA